MKDKNSDPKQWMKLYCYLITMLYNTLTCTQRKIVINETKQYNSIIYFYEHETRNEGDEWVLYQWYKISSNNKNINFVALFRKWKVFDNR